MDERRPGQPVPRGDCCAEPIELNREGNRLPVWVHVTPPADGHRVRHGGLGHEPDSRIHPGSHKAEVDRHFRLAPEQLLEEVDDRWAR